MRTKKKRSISLRSQIKAFIGITILLMLLSALAVARTGRQVQGSIDAVAAQSAVAKRISKALEMGEALPYKRAPTNRAWETAFDRVLSDVSALQREFSDVQSKTRLTEAHKAFEEARVSMDAVASSVKAEEMDEIEDDLSFVEEFVVEALGEMRQVDEMEKQKLAVTLERMEAQAGDPLRVTMLSSSVVGLITLVMGLMLMRSIRPLSEMSEVCFAVVRGNFDDEIVQRLQELESGNEVGVLARSFKKMLGDLRSAFADLNVRNESMRLVLDNVEQGLVILDQDGMQLAERSNKFEEWFGSHREGMAFADVLRSVDKELGDWFEIGWDSVREGFLPLHVSMEQLVSQVVHNGCHLNIEYKALLRDGELHNMLVMVSNVTAAVAQAEAEAKQKEFLTLFDHFLKDQAGLQSFTDETERLLNSLHAQANAGETSSETFARELHTLKGNAGLFGLSRLVSACHQLESNLQQKELKLTPMLTKALTTLWDDHAADLHRMLDAGEGYIDVPIHEIDTAREELGNGGDRQAVIARLVRWQLEPFSEQAHRMADQILALAGRLGKRELRVKTDAGNEYLEPGRLDRFWAAFSHVIRNAVDHGIEPSSERTAQGKDPGGCIGIASHTVDGGRALVLELSDDGAGIDWVTIQEKAKRLGIAHETPADLREAIFRDGFSTVKVASETSGRGVGLAAVREACENLNGSIEIESVQGEGTTFRFTIPLTETERLGRGVEVQRAA